MSYVQVEKAIYLYGPQVTVPYVPAANMLAGDVAVWGTSVGVALEPINTNNDPGGSLCIQGIFSFLKETGAAINFGDEVLWDATNQVAYVTGGGYTDSAAIGKCVKAATSADLTVAVYLNPFGHTAAG